MQRQGYPLEMSVAQSFAETASIIQSDYYIDPDTGKLREIDVMAYHTTGSEKPGHEHFIQVGCSIECKLATDKPWLLFTTQPEFPFDDSDSSESYPYAPSLAVGSKIGEWLLNKVSFPHGGIWRKPLGGFEGYEGATGYGITQAFTSGKDVPYQAVNSTFKAATAWAKKIDEDNEVASKVVSYSSIIFPTVVIDGQLFECALDKKGKLTVKEIRSGLLNWNVASDGISSKKIHIYTKPASNDLVQRVDRATTSIQAACKKLNLLDELIEFKEKVYQLPLSAIG